MKDLNRKELRKSLLYWKKELKSLTESCRKHQHDKESFMFESLETKKEDVEVIITSLEKQLGIGNEED